MRQSLRILLLMTLCTLFAVAAGLAQTPQPQTAVAAPQAVPTVAQFLAILSTAPGEVPSAGLLPPNPKLASTICRSDADCPATWKCCYPCGIPDCNFVCMQVKRCPLIP